MPDPISGSVQPLCQWLMPGVHCQRICRRIHSLLLLPQASGAEQMAGKRTEKVCSFKSGPSAWLRHNAGNCAARGFDRKNQRLSHHKVARCKSQPLRGIALAADSHAASTILARELLQDFLHLKSPDKWLNSSFSGYNERASPEASFERRTASGEKGAGYKTL